MLKPSPLGDEPENADPSDSEALGEFHEFRKVLEVGSEGDEVDFAVNARSQAGLQRTQCG